jgi:hypothetical protein
MVVTVDYKTFYFIFEVMVVTVISQKVGGGQISVGKATGQRCRPFVRTFCDFERGIKPLIVKIL